jgi:prepilin-type N-terminal cleavage/methylation domain-containing protein
MCPNSKLNRHDGFSMMELLISMAVMTIVIGAVFALIGSSLKFSSATYHTTDAEQSLRTAHEMINRDLTTAGDGLRGIGTIQVPKTFVQNYLTQTPVVEPPTSDYVNLALVTSDDNSPASIAVPQASPAATLLTGNDRITMLAQDTDFNNGIGSVSLPANKIVIAANDTTLQLTSTDIGKFQANEVYAIVSQNSAAFGVVTTVNTSNNTVVMANSNTLGLNQTGALSPIYIVSSNGTKPASIMRIKIIQYFVNDKNLLVRRIFGVKGPTFVDSTIAEHVTNLQFRYLVNLSDPNGFVPQPVRQLSTSQQQLAVREVETTVAIETAQAINAVSANDNGKQVISSTTATTVRNLQFRQAL